MAVDTYSSNLATLSYPRTGKRGVPQQFARRLYEMLQSEAKIASESKEPNAYISWSQSGIAFRIIDVEGFTSSVLPKYFRTKKFSSFQRNLNLYGFTKVRRGPDTDMYAHQSFIRGKPELLLNLRKCSSASRRKMSASSNASTTSSDSSSSSSSRETKTQPQILSPRTIVDPYLQASHVQPKLMSYEPSTNQTWLTFRQQPLMPKTTYLPKKPLNIRQSNGAGRLDLLALAVEHASF
uniref:HSF-type DNA-binding domain-containing protein n=1 Tax=Pseudo-nitzschia delicatissima TaxID=44447 RepID=A0A7S0UPI0_9STRA